jgi:hypothetical protein
LNGKRKAAAPTTEPIVLVPTPLKHVRQNDDDDQVLADFFDGYDAVMLPSETDDGNDYDFSDFLELMRTEDVDLKADAKEEALYNTIYNGANIEATTV